MPAPGTHWIGDCMGPRANLAILGARISLAPGRNQTLILRSYNP